MSKITKLVSIVSVAALAACSSKNEDERNPITYEEVAEISEKIAESDAQGEDFIAVDPADITDKSASYSGLFALVAHIEEESSYQEMALGRSNLDATFGDNGAEISGKANNF